MKMCFFLPQMVGFLDTLCGPSASQLKVKDMDKYAFDPKRLLVQITTIVLRVWKQDRSSVAASQAGHSKVDSFTVSLANHPDYSQATMTKCSSVLQKQMLGDPKFLSDFTEFVKQVLKSMLKFIPLLNIGSNNCCLTLSILHTHSHNICALG